MSLGLGMSLLAASSALGGRRRRRRGGRLELLAMLLALLISCMIVYDVRCMRWREGTMVYGGLVRVGDI